MGKSIAIICNGEFPQKEYPRFILSKSDFIICCDGGTESYMKEMYKIFGKERLPDKIIGDLDSIPDNLYKEMSERIIHVEEQDHNDQTKAFSYVIENIPDISEIHILAATGLREDHTIGNMGLLMEYNRIYDLNHIKVDMISDYSTIFAIGDSAELSIGEGRRISIISPDNSLRIESDGLVWQTRDVIFDNWWKATLNKASKDTVSLKFNHKSMCLIILD